MTERTALDTSVIVAALLAWHEAHPRALRALKVAAASSTLIIPAPALVECYSVMTRLPAPHRIAPADAIELLAGSFEGRAKIVSLSESESWKFLHTVADTEVAGGRTYDAQILQCAIKARATSMLTLDERDFQRLASEHVCIQIPR